MEATMSSPRLLALSRGLRRNMTAVERQLWSMLRRNQTGLRFRRQHPIGPYVLDFYCPSARLCVEVDGPTHEELEGIERDLARDAWLAARGIRVLRFTVAEVHERPAAVMATIAQAAPPPSP